MGSGTATIEVVASHMPGSAGQDLVNPIIEVDGEPREGNWGLNTLEVSAGRHTLKAYHKWLVFREAYASTTTVDLADGQTGLAYGGSRVQTGQVVGTLTLAGARPPGNRVEPTAVRPAETPDARHGYDDVNGTRLGRSR
jgi:hypothetical protein